MLLATNSLSEVEPADLITHHDQEIIGQCGDHEMGDRNGSSTDCELDSGDIYKNKCNHEFKNERQICPGVINSVFCNTEITSSTDQIIGYLDNNSGNKICCLSIK